MADAGGTSPSSSATSRCSGSSSPTRCRPRTRSGCSGPAARVQSGARRAARDRRAPGRGSAVRRPRPPLGDRLHRMGDEAGARSSWNGWSRAAQTPEPRRRSGRSWRAACRASCARASSRSARSTPAGGSPARRPGSPPRRSSRSLVYGYERRAGRDGLLVRLALLWVVGPVGRRARSRTARPSTSRTPVRRERGLGGGVPRLGRDRPPARRSARVCVVPVSARVPPDDTVQAGLRDRVGRLGRLPARVAAALRLLALLHGGVGGFVLVTSSRARP